jgi:hypothetical protein
MPYHVKGSVEATMHYINETSNTSFLNKKIIFLQGSPLLGETKGIKTGRLSGIVAHYTPSFLRKTQCLLGKQTVLRIGRKKF